MYTPPQRKERGESERERERRQRGQRKKATDKRETKRDGGSSKGLVTVLICKATAAQRCLIEVCRIK